jgi:uncharacterized protein YbbC (DUF1343 family)
LQQGKLCRGRDLRLASAPKGFRLDFLIDAAQQLGRATWVTRPDFFDLLAGTAELRRQIACGMSPNEIRASWQTDLAAYRVMRSKYVLYDDY